MRYLVVIMLLYMPLSGIAQTHGGDDHPPSVRDMILEHTADSYSWHITTWRGRDISIPLPVIVFDGAKPVIFLSSSLPYRGFEIAEAGRYEGKIIVSSSGKRPPDISITRNVLALMINAAILLALVLPLVSWYRRNDRSLHPRGIRGSVEMLITMVEEDIIKPCIGENYRRYSLYLLTVFFFILINNLMGLVPLFPGGANTTGNIAVTFVLALFSFFYINFFGTREYWKEVFWPEVPMWLKVPVPLMPVLEFVGIFTKPFALMVRLFANIFAGHAIILGFVCFIFVMRSTMGTAVSSGLSVMLILLAFFMSFIELLVAFIQAYVFTLLTSVFIGLSQIQNHKSTEKL